MEQRQARVIEIVSNQFFVEVQEVVYTCTSKGKFKKEEIVPVVGDLVGIEILDEEQKIGNIQKVETRINYLKRPKIANITQVLLIVSMASPKPDLLLLDKQLAYLEFLHIKPVICFNKMDLEQEEKIGELVLLYSSIGYCVFCTIAKQREEQSIAEAQEIKKIEKILKNNITVMAGNSRGRKIEFIKQTLKRKENIRRRSKQKNTTRKKHNNLHKVV